MRRTTAIGAVLWLCACNSTEVHEGGGSPVRPGDGLADGAVRVEGWYPRIDGGSTVAMASIASERWRLGLPAVPIDDCLAFAPGEDPWAPETPCSVACATGEYCGDDGACHPVPTPVGVGTIRVDGGDRPIELSFEDECEAAGCYRMTEPAPEPLFHGGETVAISAPGDERPGFEIDVRFPRPLAMTAPALRVFPEAEPIAVGESATFRWEAGDPGDDVEISFVSLYGGAVMCRARDDGEFTIAWEHLSVLPRQTNELEAFIERRTALRWNTAAGTIDAIAASVESGTFIIQP